MVTINQYPYPSLPFFLYLSLLSSSALDDNPSLLDISFSEPKDYNRELFWIISTPTFTSLSTRLLIYTSIPLREEQKKFSDIPPPLIITYLENFQLHKQVNPLSNDLLKSV